MKRSLSLLPVVCLALACSQSPRSYVERGNALAAEGKLADAELLYRKSIQKDPKFAEGYYRLSTVEYRIGRGNEALADLQRAVEFDPGNERYSIELASVAIEAYQATPTAKVLYDIAAREGDKLLKKDANS